MSSLIRLHSENFSLVRRSNLIMAVAYHSSPNGSRKLAGSYGVESYPPPDLGRPGSRIRQPGPDQYDGDYCTGRPHNSTAGGHVKYFLSAPRFMDCCLFFFIGQEGCGSGGLLPGLRTGLPGGSLGKTPGQPVFPPGHDTCQLTGRRFTASYHPSAVAVCQHPVSSPPLAASCLQIYSEIMLVSERKSDNSVQYTEI